MEKERKYIQLPPIPEDIEVPALEAIWLFAKMNPEERRDALRQLDAIIEDEETGEMDYESMQEIFDKYGEVEEDNVFSQYIECIRKLLARLVLESYDVAAYVYQKHCVEKLSLEEMMKTTRLTETALNMFVKYFDVREEQDK